MFTKTAGLVLAAAAVLSGCGAEEAMLPDTLYFAPGTPISYFGKPAKLYGTEQCVQGQLMGHSCLIFPPHRPTAKAVIIADGQVQELSVTARRDPQNPVLFVIQDEKGQRLLTTTGHSEEMANIDFTN